MRAIATAALVLLPAALLAQSAPHSESAPASRPLLQSFYVVSFDQGTWVITDVQPASGADSKVRFIKVYPACGAYHVQGDDYLFENVSVQELAGKADICAAEKTLADLFRVARRQARNKEPFWEDRHGIVAECGENVIHHLPSRESLRFDVFEAKAPQIAGLWMLSKDIWERYAKVTGHEVFAYDKQTRLDKRFLAEQAAIELRNGDFDLAAPDVPDNLRTEGRSKLSEIVPEVAEATGPEEDFGVVENLDQLGIENYEDIRYPQMARIAHISGDINLEVSIDPASGSIRGVTAHGGHAILQIGATEAVKKWVFLHPYFGPNPLPVKIHFQVRCPLILNTSAVETSPKKPKKKRQH
jgi:Gram-negative bacterial TonB protein C-terminal